MSIMVSLSLSKIQHQQYLSIGRIQFCLPAPNIVLKTKNVENEAQNAVVKSYLSKTVGSQRNKIIPS